MTQTTAVVVTTTFRSELRLLAALICASSLLFGCSSCGNGGEPTATTAPAEDLSPVAEPDGVVAEVLMGQPDQTWKRLRAITGGPVNLMPVSYPVLVATLLGLPPTVSGAFDTDVPTVGAIVAPGPDEVTAVLAMHVKSGRELVAALTTGAQAKYAAKLDAASGVTVLEPKTASNALAALGVVGNHLIAAPKAELLTRFGPFVARTLPKRTMPSEGIVATFSKKGLATSVAGRLRARWKAYAGELQTADRKNRDLHGGRAPDFGDPMVALAGVGSAVERLALVLESSKQAKLTLVPRDDRLEAKLDVEPEPGGAAAKAIADMTVGDLAPLLVLPRAMDVVIVNRTTAASREESARSLVEGANKLFGDRLSAADGKRIEKVLTDLAQARGDDASYGLHSKDGKTSLVFRGTVSDEQKFATGVKGAIELLRLRAISEPVKQFVGEVTTKSGTREIPGVGKVSQTKLSLKPSPMRTPAGGGAVTMGPRDFELVWLVKDGVGYAALSSDPSVAIVDLVSATGETALGADRGVRTSVERGGGSTTFAVYAQPLRLGLGHSMKGSAPVFIGLGKTGTNGWLRLDADGAALKAIVSRFVRF
jgi:hypothetical protein